MIMTRTRRVLVAGAGFAGLETAFYLHKRLGSRAEVQLISDSDRFVFKPSTVYIPFGYDAARTSFAVEQPLRRQKIGFVHAPVLEVDVRSRTVRAGDQRLSYDYLVIATGASTRPIEVPGLAEYGRSIATTAGMLELRGAFEALTQPGKRQRVLFLVPPHNRCASPLYELALMLDTWLRWRGARDRVEIVWATHEFGFLQAFGPLMDAEVAQEFSRRGIEARKQTAVAGVEPGVVSFRNGDRLAYDLLVSFPPSVGTAAFPSLESDERSFLRTEMETRRVAGQDRIFAAGDASDFPVNQAFLAWQQADAAAEQIAAAIMGVAPRVVFEPLTLCVMEQFDRATFARVPLRATGRADKPIVVDIDHEDYRVETSTVWRLGKKAFGAYVPWRLRAGEPLHAGWPRRGVDAGVGLLTRASALQASQR